MGWVWLETEICGKGEVGWVWLDMRYLVRGRWVWLDMEVCGQGEMGLVRYGGVWSG